MAADFRGGAREVLSSITKKFQCRCRPEGFRRNRKQSSSRFVAESIKRRRRSFRRNRKISQDSAKKIMLEQVTSDIAHTVRHIREMLRKNTAVIIQLFNFLCLFRWKKFLQAFDENTLDVTNGRHAQERPLFQGREELPKPGLRSTTSFTFSPKTSPQDQPVL